VQVFLDCKQLHGVEVVRRLFDALLLAVLLAGLVLFLSLISVLEVGHVAAVQDVVQVFEHAVVDDLAVQN